MYATLRKDARDARDSAAAAQVRAAETAIEMQKHAEEAKAAAVQSAAASMEMAERALTFHKERIQQLENIVRSQAGEQSRLSGEVAELRSRPDMQAVASALTRIETKLATTTVNISTEGAR